MWGGLESGCAVWLGYQKGCHGQNLSCLADCCCMCVCMKMCVYWLYSLVFFFFTNGRENKSRQLNNCHLVLVKTLNGFMKEFLLNDWWKGLG